MRFPAENDTSEALSINASGQTVGFYSFYIFGGNGFRTTAGGNVRDHNADLGGLGGSGSRGYAINDSGQVAGSASLAGNTITHAVRTSPTGRFSDPGTDLGTLGGTNSVAYGINASGQVTGMADLPDGTQHAFRTTGTGKISDPGTDLGSLGGSSGGLGINSSGRVVGYSSLDVDNFEYHAFRTTVAGKVSDPGADLGTLGGLTSRAYGINSAGQVVGESDRSDNFNGPAAFFVDVTGQMQNLNDLIPSGSEWFLTRATGINDSGQIVGSGRIGDETHAFLLTPTPEPGSLAVLLLGLAGLLRRSRRQAVRFRNECRV